MTVNALSGHGTILYRNGTAIAELGDITPPALTRNEFDTTTQDEDIDSYILGVLRRSAMTFPLNFIPQEGTHDHLTGLYDAIISNSVDEYKVIFPDATVWIMSGMVQNIVPTAPLDGKLSANVTLRFSGPMQIGSLIIGASIIP
jgi:hypothetical protein